MSAPNQGRQSPEPEKESEKQKGTQGSGKLDESKQKDEGKESQLEGLESNPKHILEDNANKSTSKDEGPLSGP